MRLLGRPPAIWLLVAVLCVAPPVLADGEETDELVPVEDGHTGEIVMIPRSELEPPPEAAVEAPVDEAARLATPVPIRWLTSEGRDCHRYRRRFVCEGPLRVAAPHGPGAELARRIGIGEDITAQWLLGHGPRPEWTRAVEGRESRSLRWPVDGGSLSRGYGHVSRRGGRGRRLHKGVDIWAAAGTHVLAANDGLVVYANNNVSGYGNLITVVHRDASVTMYAHLQAAYVFAGMQVLRGQTIGEVGATGLAHGAHLHFEYRVEGYPRNPAPLFEERGPARVAAR